MSGARVTPALRLQWVVDSEEAHKLAGAPLYDAPPETTALLREALAALVRGRPQILGVLVQQDQDAAINALRAHLGDPAP